MPRVPRHAGTDPPAPLRWPPSAGRTLVSLQSVDFVQILVGFSVLLVSLTVHEAAHAWTADRLGDPTARLLGRVSLNPAAHVDLIGTVLFPLIAMISSLPLIGWAKPVPVDVRNLRHPRRDYLLRRGRRARVSNLVLAVVAAIVFRGDRRRRPAPMVTAVLATVRAAQRPARRVQHDSGAAARRRQRAGRAAARVGGPQLRPRCGPTASSSSTP